MRIAFFTATMGGAGHLVHALAVERGLRRQGFEGVFRVVGPEVPYPVEHGLDYVVGTVPRAAFRAAEAALATAAARELLAFDPDVLLVDMFWAPLTHVLPALRGEAWLLLHTVPRSWLRGPLKNRFQPELFARVLATEPMRHHPELDAIPPVVVCNPDEQQPVMALKQHLGVPLDQHLTLVAQTGMPGELERLAEQAKEQGSVVCSLSLRQPGALFPLAPYLCGADRILGGAGYNLWWETRWLGLSDRTHCVAFDRTIDDQAFRASSGLIPQENGADVLARMLVP